MPTTELILVKHAMPAIVPDVPAREWRLSDEGRAASVKLAQRLKAHRPGVVITSDEPKAAETGGIVASVLDVPIHMARGLHEHDRSTAPFLGQAGFEAVMETFFSEPDKLVFGNETAAQARERFAVAIEAIAAVYPDDTVVVVAHGTVITLLVSHIAEIEPYPLWKRLGLPSFVVLEPPSLRLLSLVADVTGE